MVKFRLTLQRKSTVFREAQSTTGEQN